MLERRTALALAEPFKSRVLEIGEARGFALTQAAGQSASFEKELEQATGKIPEKIGTAVQSRGRTIMRTGPSQFWIVGGENDRIGAKLAEFCAVTPLSHSRTRIFLEGEAARDVLAKGIPLDFLTSAFTPGMFAMSGIHHTPVLVHCVGQNRFEIYAMRTFAMSVWDWLLDAALEFADHPR